MTRIAILCCVVGSMLYINEINAQDRGFALSIAWSPDGETIAVGSTTGVWLFDSDFKDLAHIEVSEFEGFPPNTLDWSASGKLLAFGYAGHRFPIVIVDVVEQIVVSRIPVRLKSTIRWHPNKNNVMAGTWRGTTHIWDALTGQELFYFEESFTEEYSVDIYTQSVCWLNHNLIATMGSGTSYVVDISETNTAIQIPSPYVSVAKCNSDGDILMVGITGEVGDIRADMSWEDMLDSSYQSGNEPVLAVDVAWSPDGSRFVANGKGCLVHVFDRVSRKQLAELEGSYSDVWGTSAYVDSVAWHSDGTRFAVVGQFDIRMWDAESFELLHQYDGFEVGYDQGISYAIELSEEERKKEMEEHGVKCPAPSLQRNGAEKG